jgi:hypothetical protein
MQAKADLVPVAILAPARCWVLDRYEAGIESPIAYPDHAAFPSVPAHDGFARELDEAERTGAIFIARGRGKKPWNKKNSILKFLQDAKSHD